MIQALKHTLANNRLLSNTSWLFGAEAMARVSRLVTLLALAHFLSIAEYGSVMLALICHDLLRVLTRIGSGAKVIQCSEQALASVAGNAITLQWLVALGVAGLQFLLATPLAAFYDKPELVSLLQTMAISHLIYPLVTIKVFLLQRQQGMRYFGLASGLCMVIENLSVAVFLFFGAELHSAAMAKVLAAVVWVMLFSRIANATLRARFEPEVFISLASFALRVLLTESLKMFRFNMDVLLAGKMLGPELLGIYTFAKSAGIGISQSIATAFHSGLYPWLCELQRKQAMHEAQGKVVFAVAFIAAMFLLQAWLVPYYITLLFSSQWGDALSTSATLCLAAIPMLLIDTHCVFLRARNRIMEELMTMACASALLWLGLQFSQAESPQAFANTIVVASIITFFVCLCLSYVSKKINPDSTVDLQLLSNKRQVL